MSRIPTIALAVAVLAGGWSAGCDKPPTQPTRTNPPPPPPPGQPTLQSIRAEGPTSVPPGTKAQYTATGQMSDGNTQDLTSTTTWRSSDNGVLDVAANGEATGGKAGEAVVAAENNGKRSSVQVLVLAPGTYRLMGLVSDNGMPVAGAIVDILDGSRAVMSVRTDGEGIYRFYGVAGDVELRVRAEGYPDQVHGIPVANDARLDFQMPATATLNGLYELTITADANCPRSGRNALPEELRVRIYGATVTQNGRQLSVKLSGGSLQVGSFSGSVNGAAATFDIHGITTDPFYYYYTYIDKTIDLVENLSPSSYFLISGKASTSQVSTGVAGELSGVMGVLPGLSGYANFTTSCWGKQKFVLTRR